MEFKRPLEKIKSFLDQNVPPVLKKNNLEPFDSISIFNPIQENKKNISIFPESSKQDEKEILRVFIQLNLPSTKGLDAVLYHDLIINILPKIKIEDSFDQIKMVESDFLLERKTDSIIVFYVVEFERFLNDC